MSNPEVPDSDPESDPASATPAAPAEPATEPDAPEQVTDVHPRVADDAEAATEVLPTEAATEAAPHPVDAEPQRRFTAPGFDAGQTEVMAPVPEPPTEVFDPRPGQPGSAKAVPQRILPRLASKLPAPVSRSWGWVMAVVLIILTLAAIAVLGTLWLTHDSRVRASQEERVRDSIYRFDIAVQTGDLPTLRGLTCGSVRDNYLNYTEQAWGDTYQRIAAAKQYPVVASIDEVVVNGDRAEANVTAFMAYAPQVRSTRSFDLQYHDDQWKICQSRSG